MNFPDFTAQTLDIGFESYDPKELEYLKSLIKKKEPGSILLTMPEEEMLLSLGILKRTQTSIRTTIAGLLLLGKEDILRTILPSAEVDYLHMISESSYDKRIDYTKPLLNLLTTLTSTIQQYNQILKIKIGLFDYEIPDYPPEVYREVLLNAVVHRDYSLMSPIYIRHYSNYLEIVSPGSFLGGITSANILIHEPVIRNPLLATILHQIGIMEKAGIGAKRVFATLLSLGKEPPHFESKEQFVQVTIHNGNVDERFATYILQYINKGKELSLTDLLVLSFLKRNREIEIKEASHLVQKPEYQTKELLNSMIERGFLEPFGLTRGTVYRLSKAVFTQLRRSVEYRLHRRAEAAYAENLILEYIKENGFITNEICRTLLRINRSQVIYLLNRLVQKGKLTQPTKGRKARYLRKHP